MVKWIGIMDWCREFTNTKQTWIHTVHLWRYFSLVPIRLETKWVWESHEIRRAIWEKCNKSSGVISLLISWTVVVVNGLQSKNNYIIYHKVKWFAKKAGIHRMQTSCLSLNEEGCVHLHKECLALLPTQQIKWPLMGQLHYGSRWFYLAQI